MKTMKTAIKYGLLGAALSLAVFASAKSLDNIIVVVNDDVVTGLELRDRVELIKQQYQSNPSVLPQDSVLNKQVLDALILESLQLQLAKRGNLIIPDQQIDQALQNIAQNQKLTLSQFMSALEHSGRNVQKFRSQIRNELTISELQKQIIGRQIFISNAEVERFLTSQSGQSLQDTQYQLSYRRFEQSEQAKAQAALDEINSGAVTLLDTDGTDLGMRTLKDIPSIFKTIVPVLEINEAILLDRNGALHLAQLASKTEQKSVNVQEFRVRHILIKTDVLFDEKSAQALIADLKTQIDNGASMEELANVYSQDTGSRGRGGDLDWNNLDTFVPEFSHAARKTPEGKLSDVFQTQFGFHILRVEGIRTRDVGLDVLRNQIKNQITQSRYNESLQRWLTELRAESFVEFR